MYVGGWQSRYDVCVWLETMLVFVRLLDELKANIRFKTRWTVKVREKRTSSVF
jgi:protein-S-isoprenylcysteine O-methyltransferase Ste14